MVWLRRETNTLTAHNIPRKAALAALSSIVVVAIDLVMEPLQVNTGNWNWPAGGPYFGIPLGNFFGWFTVSFLSILLFEAIGRNTPPKELQIDARILLIPVVGYGLLGMIFFFWALRIGMLSLAIIGLIVISPIVIINLILFRRWKRRLNMTGHHT